MMARLDSHGTRMDVVRLRLADVPMCIVKDMQLLHGHGVLVTALPMIYCKAAGTITSSRDLCVHCICIVLLGAAAACTVYRDTCKVHLLAIELKELTPAKWPATAWCTCFAVRQCTCKKQRALQL